MSRDRDVTPDLAWMVSGRPLDVLWLVVVVLAFTCEGAAAGVFHRLSLRRRRNPAPRARSTLLHLLHLSRVSLALQARWRKPICCVRRTRPTG